ncbi:hypothetical protein J6590_027998 [Homalodisca vitripennis]|nr:hypothetical protein J6590_027998 [Homalodisca vitripennis]
MPANLPCGQVRQPSPVFRPPAESSQILSSPQSARRSSAVLSPKFRCRHHAVRPPNPSGPLVKVTQSADRGPAAHPPNPPRSSRLADRSHVAKAPTEVPWYARQPALWSSPPTKSRVPSTRRILPDPLVSAVSTSKFRSPLAEVPLPTPRSPPAESFGSSRQGTQSANQVPCSVRPPNPPRSSRLRSRHVEVPQSSRRSSAADTTQSARRILRVLSSRSRSPLTEVPCPVSRPPTAVPCPVRQTFLDPFVKRSPAVRQPRSLGPYPNRSPVVHTPNARYPTGAAQTQVRRSFVVLSIKHHSRMAEVCPPKSRDPSNIKYI